MTEYRVVEFKSVKGRWWSVEKRIRPDMAWEYEYPAVRFPSKRKAVGWVKDATTPITRKVVWP